MGTLLRIGELATRAGVSPRTVDYYTGLGLVLPAGRTGGGFRMYDPAAIDVIAMIKKLEQHGVSLSDIASALHTTDVDVQAQLTALTAKVNTALLHAACTPPATQALVALIAQRAAALLDIANVVGPAHAHLTEEADPADIAAAELTT